MTEEKAAQGAEDQAPLPPLTINGQFIKDLSFEAVITSYSIHYTKLYEPKNILMIGPTGVGKTEIARRLARLAQAPFIKVEATKFTEVGYVGRDVESIIRDLLESAIQMARVRLRADVRVKAEAAAEERVLDALVGASANPETRAKFRAMLRKGELDGKSIEIEVKDSGGNALPTFDLPNMPGRNNFV